MTRLWRLFSRQFLLRCLRLPSRVHTHVIINISGDISLMDANDAASYVQELTGEDANIIFGAMYDDSVADYARITVIATGLYRQCTGQQPIWKQGKQFRIFQQETGFHSICRREPEHA